MSRPLCLVVSMADRIAVRPLPFVLLLLLLAAVALAGTLQHLRIDTSTTEMISPDAPFRRDQRSFSEAFPAFGDTVVAVIEGRSPERVEGAARALADALRANDHFSAVAYPAGEPFFERHALLYLPLDELAALTDQLAEGGTLIAPVGGAGSQALLKLRKDADGVVTQQNLAPVVFVPLLSGMVD